MPTPQPKVFSLTLIYWCILVLYATLVFCGITHHEPWRDEAQSWLLARDLNPLNLIQQLPAEGHPPLWYLLIMPLAKGGAPYISQNYLSGAVMITVAWLLLFKTKIPFIIKVTCIFSYLQLYEYAVIARSYCLVPLFVLLIVLLYPAKFKRPWLFGLSIVGLFNAHMLAFTFAATITGIFAFEAFQQKQWNKNTVGAFAFMIIGGGYLIPYLVLSSPTANMFGSTVTDHIGQLLRTFSGAFFVENGFKYLGLLVAWIFAVLLIGKPKPLLILLGGMVGVLYILAFRFAGGEQHQGVMFCCVLGAYGIGKDYCVITFAPIQKHSSLVTGLLLTAILIFQDYKGISSYLVDIREPNSDAINAAHFLREMHLDSKILVGNKSFATSAVIPFLKTNTRFYYPDCNRWGSFIMLDGCALHNMFIFTSDSAARIVETVFSDRLADVVLVLNTPLLTSYQQSKWILIYSTKRHPMHAVESYNIYTHSER